MNIILCGLPGSGKTTIGKLTALQLQRQFLDTDQSIEQLYFLLKNKNKSCRQITIDEGENFFRDLENKVVNLINTNSPTVIATGGGTLLNSDNILKLKKHGKIIYLQGDPTLIFERIMRKGTPTYLDANNPLESFKALARNRQQIYEYACHHCININYLTSNEIVNKICDWDNLKDKS